MLASHGGPDVTVHDSRPRGDPRRSQGSCAQCALAGPTGGERLEPRYRTRLSPGLANEWANRYQWRDHEQDLNRLHHFQSAIAGTTLHFVHERGVGDSPLPIVLTHGWPSSFYRYTKLIPLLTDPVSDGGSAEDAFDGVVPWLPGYGFSDRLRPPTLTSRRTWKPHR
jgi:hypothetical protein